MAGSYRRFGRGAVAGRKGRGEEKITKTAKTLIKVVRAGVRLSKALPLHSKALPLHSLRR